jgi:hypothetical protein
MALRVARGLFRLWLVLSVLWIGGVGYVTWQTVPSASFDNHAAVMRHELPSIEEANRAIEADNRLHKVLLYEHLWHASVFAIAPPLFVLALGSALIWAFRGFR